MNKLGRPKKDITEKRVTISPHVCPKWLKNFRAWSKTQPDSQGKQVEAGINLLIKEREHE